MELLVIAAALFVAFSNSANDNFKGFATVWGSQTLNYRSALLLVTAATVAGSLVSMLLAEGLVSDAVAAAPQFILSVAVGTAATVFLATRAGFPVSIIHALIGSQVGEVHFAKLAGSFLIPRLISPLLAAFLGAVAYRALRRPATLAECAYLVSADQGAK